MPKQKIIETADAFSDCFFGAGSGDEKAKRLMDFANETEASIKTKKTVTGGAKRATKNATLIVRFAHSIGIEHPKIADYYEGDSGISMPNDFQSIKEISIAVINHFKASTMETTRDNIRQGFITYVESFNTTTTQPQTEDTTNNDMSIDFGNDMPSLDDLVEDEEVEEAQATELDYIFTAMNAETFKVIQAVNDEDIEAAKAVLFNLAKDGQGYSQSKNDGTVRLSAAQIEKMKTYGDFSIFQSVAADILQLRPVASVKRVGYDFNRRHWFAELCGHLSRNKYKAVQRILVKMAAAVINGSGRKFYNMRLTHFVSKQFINDMQNFIQLNQEVADSKVIGSPYGAKDWRWVPKENNWSPTKSTAMSNADIDSLSFEDLHNL